METKDIDTLSPAEYAVWPASLDEAVFHALLEAYYPQMRRLGRELSHLGVLPVQEEPKGSGRFVTTGNYSMRVGAEDFLITGSNVDKGVLRREDLLYVERIDYTKGAYFMHGTARPSRETLIHDQLYRAYPSARTIVHMHDDFALRYGESEQTPEPIFFATLQEARKVVSAVWPYHYVTLPGHGQFVIAENIDKALSEVRDTHHRSGKIISAGIATTFAAMVALLFQVMVRTDFRARLDNCTFTADATRMTERYTCSPQQECPLNDGAIAQGRNPDGTVWCTYRMVQYGNP